MLSETLDEFLVRLENLIKEGENLAKDDCPFEEF